MIELGLRTDEHRAFMRALLAPHILMRATGTIRDRDEQPIARVTNRIIDGAVQIDAAAEVSRSLEMSVLDPDRKLRLEGESAADGALFADNFVSVSWGVFVPELGDWVDVPVFWGPITRLNRQGAIVRLEAQGKERLMLDPHFVLDGYTLPKGLSVDQAIRRVAAKAGERRFNLPDIKRTLGEPRTVPSRSEPWKVLTGGAQDAKGRRIEGIVERAPGNRYLFYDGRGRLTLRRKNQNPVLTIDARRLVEQPDVSYDVMDSINTVEITGRERGDKGGALVARVSLPPGHALSPRRLARNGEPRHMIEFVDTDLRTLRELNERGDRVLRRLSAQGVEAALACLPVPHLEEHDVVRVRTPELDFNFPAKQFTIPLTPGPMTIGANRRVGRWRARRRATREWTREWRGRRSSVVRGVGVA